MTTKGNTVDTISYELNRLLAFLEEYELTPDLRQQVISVVDYAAWEQLTTSMRGLKATARNIEGQVRKRSGRTV